MLCGGAYGQKLKYKDIHPLILEEKYQEAGPYLRNFLLSEPDHPSANLQMAMIYNKRYKSYHPLLDYESAFRNLDQAEKYFLKARLLVDEKEVKKNGKKYYINLAKIENEEPNYFRIRQGIDSAIFEIERFKHYTPEIYNSYKHWISFYNLAIEKFRQVNKEYHNLNDLYLLYDEKLKNTLIRLKSDYDSCIYYLDDFLQFTRIYPLIQYTQSVELEPVLFYRRDGLIPVTDLLSQKIHLWNYGQWVEQILNVVDTEITPFRKSMESTVEKLLITQDHPVNGYDFDHSEIIITDMIQDLFPVLRKYDPASSLFPLLHYLWFKNRLFYKIQWEVDNATRISRNISHENQLIFYNQFLTQLFICDSLINSVNNLHAIQDKRRHQQLFEKYFDGKDGLSAFIVNEKKLIIKMKHVYAEKLRSSFQNYSNLDSDSVRFTEYKKQQIPLYVNLPDSAMEIDFACYTSQILFTPDSSMFLAGLTRPKSRDNEIRFFLSRVNRNAEVVWFKIDTFSEEVYKSIDDAENTKTGKMITDVIRAQMELTPQGIVLVLSVRDRISGKLYTIFKLIDEEGVEMMSAIINVEAIIRILRYHEGSDSFILSFQGTDFNMNSQRPEEVYILKIDNLSNEVWRYNMLLRGNIVEILDFENGYLVFGNSSAIKEQSESEHNTPRAGQWISPFVSVLEKNGKYTGIHVYIFKLPFCIGGVLKVTENGIHLFGNSIKSLIGSGSFKDCKSLASHFITNMDYDVLYSNFELTD